MKVGLVLCLVLSVALAGCQQQHALSPPAPHRRGCVSQRGSIYLFDPFCRGWASYDR